MNREKTFAVSIKGLAPWIESMRYEKNNTDLNLYFTLKGQEFPVPNSVHYPTNLEYHTHSLLFSATLSNEQAKHVIEIVQKLKQEKGEQYSFLLFFGQQGVLWSKNRILQDKILIATRGTGKGNWVLFKKSEQDVRSLLS
jgi:hypothetical protein